MRETIKQIIPSFLLEWYRIIKFRNRKKKFRFLNKPTSAIFEEIYDSNYWSDKESVSGHGSTDQQTHIIREKIPSLLKRFNIHSMLDIPCGDFNWMKKVDLSEIQYIGADIVPALIEKNNRLYRQPNITFCHLDLTKDTLPKVDLILCRDCLVHLSYEDSYAAISNIINSGCTYLLTTSYPEKKNYEIATGDWWPFNLCQSPFNFPPPTEEIVEGCTEGYQQWCADKTLSLWKIEDIKLPKKVYHQKWI